MPSGMETVTMVSGRRKFGEKWPFVHLLPLTRRQFCSQSDYLAEERMTKIARLVGDRPASRSAARLHRCGVTTRVRQAVAVVLVGLTALLGGCSENGLMARFQLAPKHIIVERRADAAYERLFPYYVELCAASQFQSKLTREGGGPAGHAVLYLKGACKIDDAPFPQLQRCTRVASSLDDPKHGVGISVNQYFKNVNWVAIPGYDLFFEGNLAQASG